MKAPRATCEGYLTLRTSPSSPPPMLRRYCFLVGTCFYYYSTQEDAYHMLRLKGEVDVLGVQEWDGKGNMHIYQNGFLFATAQNKVFYAYADSAMDKEKWMRAIQMTVETTIPRLTPVLFHSSSSSTLNTDVQSPSSGPVPVGEADSKCVCLQCRKLEKEGNPAPAASAILYKCHSCEALWCEKFTTHKIPLLHRSHYYSKRVCDYCHEAQMYLNYLRAMLERLKAGICLYPKPLNPETPVELIMPKRPSHTAAAAIAIGMFKRGEITAEECEELMMGDRRYLDNTVDHPEIPLDLKILALHREFRSKGFSVYRAVILLHRHLDSDPLLFKPIVEKLLHFSYTRINQVEFYWPQIVHAYLTVPMFDFEKIFWLDELVLSICSRSIHLALLLRWQLQGALEDSLNPNLPRDMHDKYARVVRLMVQVEQEVVGSDLPTLLRRDLTSLKKNTLPMPTEEQLVILQHVMDEIAEFRKEAHANAAANTSDNQFLQLSPTSSSRIGENGEDVRFRDFSRFQQHLLTPRDDLALTGMSGDNAEPARMSVIEEEDNVDRQPTSIFTGPVRRMSHAEKSVLAKHFADECDFVEQITDISEALRFVPSVAERKKQLPSYLEKIRLPPMAYVPLVKATDPFERIIRIPTNEGTAFSTKARVPVLLIFEVIRGNFFGNENVLSPSSPFNRKSCTNSEVLQKVALEYQEDDEVGRMIEHQAPDGFAATGDEVGDEHISEGAHEMPPDQMVDPTSVNLNLDVPETPCEMPNNLETPSAAAARTPIAESDSGGGGFASRIGIDLSAATLTQEAIERENDRRKDLEAAFGESWSSRRKRLKEASPVGHLEGWDIVSMLGKSNDDLRQEVFTLQLIQKFIEIFRASNLPIWLKSYRIIATSSTCGLIETLCNAISLDGLKKREGYVSLLQHFEKSYGPQDTPQCIEARRNFIQSMAGYSLVSYFLQIKDRHNGNIMLDNEGHIIHIDYGFLLGIAPGGSFSIETAPFKLTAEMVETMGGTESDGFKEYVTLCTRGFLACQQHCDEICDLVDVMAHQSPYPCFAGKDVSYILSKLRSRFKLSLSKQETVVHVLSLIRKSNSNYSTRQYDNFQRMTNGILP